MNDTLQFTGQIYVYGGEDFNQLFHTCDTMEQASQWIEDNGIPESERDWDYTIDGTPEAWHEQNGYCGGSTIGDC